MEKIKQYSNEFIRFKYMALNYKREGNYELALTFINKALNIQPEVIDLLADKAEVLYKITSYNQSMEIFKELIAIDNGRFTYLHGYYKCLYRLDHHITVSDIENLIYLKEEDSLYFFEKKLLSDQKDNLLFKETLFNYFPEFALPESVLHLPMKEARKIIARAYEKSNKRKRMLARVYYLKGLYKSLFSYLSKEIKKAPNRWINYEIYSEYKSLLGETEKAIDMIRQFEAQNPEQILVSAVQHVTLLKESDRLENAKEIVSNAQEFISIKENSGIKVTDHEYKRLKKIKVIIG